MIIPPQGLVLYPLDTAVLTDHTRKLQWTRNARLGVPEFIKVFLVALALAVCAPAYGAPRESATKVRRPASTNATVTISLSDYGAAGDGVTDDGPALQSALKALADAGGGSLIVPSGRYALASPVTLDFANRATAIDIQGTPSSAPYDGSGDPGRGLNLTSEFLIKAGETNDALTLHNLDTLSLENLVFIGDLPAANDARVVLRLSGIKSTTINICEFYGLSTLVADGAIVYEEGGELKISGSAFLGCAGNSGTYTSIVQVYSWTGLSINATRFIDYGDRPGFYSKTTIMSPYSWVSVGGAAPLTNLSPRRDISIKNVLFDEGAYYALSVIPGVFAVANGGAISSLYLSNLYVNVTNLGEVGLRIQYVDNVFIEHSHFGWSHNTRGAMQLSDVKNAVLNQIECVESANTIIADDTVGEISVINSVYETLDSQAPITRVITTPDPQDGPAEYVTQKYLDILGHDPDIPGYIYWSQQRARCHDDANCTVEQELLAYVNGTPAPIFTIVGRLVDTVGSPIAAATVTLNGAHSINTVTDVNGEYTFAGLATSGEYTVTPSRTFYTFSADDGGSSRSFNAPLGDETGDFTGSLANYSIQGRVNDAQVQSMSEVTVTLTGGPAGFDPQSQISTSAGDYSFADLPAGYSYALTATKDFYTFAPPTKTLVLAGDTFNLDFAGTPLTHTIAGQVTDGSVPLAGATVTVSGDANGSSLSDDNGNYTFDGLVAGGTYVVTATKRHYAFTSQTINNLLSDSIVDFAGYHIRYTITGVVTSGPNGVGSVTVTLAGDQAETVLSSSGGNYVFTVNAGGNYTLSAAKDGYGFGPQSFVFNDLDQNVYPNFTATPLPVLITDESTNRAIAFNSITMLSGPFDLFTTPFDFGPDRRTRVVLFARLGTDGSPTITAVGQDSQGHVYPLIVEFAGPLPDLPGVSQLNVKLDSQLSPAGDVGIKIVVNGLTSNTVLVRLN